MDAAPRPRAFWLVPLLGCLPGAVWLLHSAHAAVTQGADADIPRLWRAAQFLRAGVNPYPPARAALEAAYGPSAGGQLSRAGIQVHAIPSREAHRAAATAVAPHAAGLLARYGVPEATYPPSANLLLTGTIGLLPVAGLTEGWTVFNLVLAGAVLALLCVGRGRLLTELPAWTVAALFLLWSPTHDAVRATQFSLLVFVCLLGAARLWDARPVAAGFLLGVALLKPSVAAPFVFLPLVRGRWRTVAVAAGLHLAATAAVGAWCGCPSWQLPGQWLAVAGYFTQGTCSLQEVINRLHLDNTPAGLALTGGFLLAVLAWCWRHRAAPAETLFDFVCFASALWTYHRPYDLVVLFVPLVRCLTEPRRGVRLTAAGSFVVLSLALASGFLGVWYHPAFRALRWLARLLLAAWFVALALRLRSLPTPAAAAEALARSPAPQPSAA